MPYFLENARRAWQPFDVTFFNMDDGIVGGYTKEKIALRRAISLGFDRPTAGVPRHASTDPALAGYFTHTPDALSQPDGESGTPFC